MDIKRLLTLSGIKLDEYYPGYNADEDFEPDYSDELPDFVENYIIDGNHIMKVDDVVKTVKNAMSKIYNTPKRLQYLKLNLQAKGVETDLSSATSTDDIVDALVGDLAGKVFVPRQYDVDNAHANTETATDFAMDYVSNELSPSSVSNNAASDLLLAKYIQSEGVYGDSSLDIAKKIANANSDYWTKKYQEHKSDNY